MNRSSFNGLKIQRTFCPGQHSNHLCDEVCQDTTGNIQSCVILEKSDVFVASNIRAQILALNSKKGKDGYTNKRYSCRVPDGYLYQHIKYYDIKCTSMKLKFCSMPPDEDKSIMMLHAKLRLI
ncbi:hypothetical protein TNCV_2794401 [Trichonephila clavipes]|nr:hypothetical protein TNCV_2794401 [Trichonephila clavipes]